MTVIIIDSIHVGIYIFIYIKHKVYQLTPPISHDQSPIKTAYHIRIERLMIVLYDNGIKKI